jgi:hypothetical protein
MKKLERISFDYALCRQQVEGLRGWLAAKEELSERKDILPFSSGARSRRSSLGRLTARSGGPIGLPGSLTSSATSPVTW